jgi:hypothetical protein
LSLDETGLGIPKASYSGFLGDLCDYAESVVSPGETDICTQLGARNKDGLYEQISTTPEIADKKIFNIAIQRLYKESYLPGDCSISLPDVDFQELS